MPVRPLLSRQGSLSIETGADSQAGIGEDREEAVPLGVHLRAAEGADDRPEDPPLRLQRLPVGRRETLDQTGGTFHVGEEKGDIAAVQLARKGGRGRDLGRTQIDVRILIEDGRLERFDFEVGLYPKLLVQQFVEFLVFPQGLGLAPGSVQGQHLLLPEPLSERAPR